jgi:acetyl esterase/lipase
VQRTFVLQPYSIPSRALTAAAYAGLRLANALEAGNRAVVRHRDRCYGAAPRQRLDVYVPAAPDAAPGRVTRPVVVFLHGGYWTYFGKQDFAYVGHALAERGCVAVVPAYRRYPHVGLDAQLQDAALAVRWALRHAGEHGGATERVTLVGHSSGAHLAAMLALDPSRLARVGLTRDRIAGLVGLSGPYHFSPDANGCMARFFGPRERHASVLPVNFARAGAPPALLVHGLRDALVRPQNTRELARRLRAASVPVVLHLAPGDGHGTALERWVRPRRRHDALLAAVARFAGARGAAIMGTPPSEVPPTCIHRAPERSPSS